MQALWTANLKVMVWTWRARSKGILLRYGWNPTARLPIPQFQRTRTEALRLVKNTVGACPSALILVDPSIDANQVWLY
jgi:hypothetical protein